jgi:hypothetical protein
LIRVEFTPLPLLSLEQIRKLAPDEASFGSAQKISHPHLWQLYASTTTTLWGLFQGGALYQVKIDLARFGYHCTCPSRKFPCKHVLGLLVLAAAIPQDSEATSPDWVSLWLGKRQEKEARKDEPAPSKKPVDEKAQQKRADQRLERVREGLENLEKWLADLIRNGLASLETRGPGLWDEQARRLVDAQAPGLATRLRKLAEIPASGKDWPARLLDELGRLQLILEAFRRIHQLDPELAADLRQLIGWTLTSADLEKTGERLDDDWLVLGQIQDEDERIKTLRTWCLGRASRRMALVLQFAPIRQPFTQSLLPGSLHPGTMVFYPGRARQRAQFLSPEEPPVAFTQPLPALPLVEAFLDDVSLQLARLPWLSTFGCSLDAVRLTLHNDQWLILDVAGQALPLAGRDHWSLLARTGGEPCTLTGEWDGRLLLPFGCFHQGRYQVL